MPVDFLTDEQERQYGRFAGEPTPAHLARSFYFDDADRALIADRRGDHNKLGFALQLVTVRFLGTFLADPTDVPANVVVHVAAQLGIADQACLDRYRVGETRWDHADEIKRIYGYRDFGDQPEHVRLVRWLYARAWVSAERPSMLFDLSTARLVERKVLLPGVTTLARLVARVRDRVAERLWETLAAAPNDVQRARLERLVVVPTGQRVSPLEQLGRSPTRANAAGLLGALKRLGAFQALNVGGLDLAHVPASRITALARHAAGAWAGTIARMPPDRRVATLLAFARVYEARAQDDALDVLDQVIVALFARVEREGDRARLGALRALDVAALLLRDVARMVRDVEIRDAEVRATIEEAIGDAAIDHAIAVVDALTRPPDDHYYDDLFTRYSTMRQFLPALLRTVAFEGTTAARPVLDAVAYLRDIEGQKDPDMLEAPLAVVLPAWRRLVVQTAPTYRVDRKAYTFALLEQLQTALKRHDVFVSPSEKWADPRAKLLQGAAWEAARPQVCRALGHTTDAAIELETLSHHLDASYRRTAANLATNPFVRVEREKGRDTVVISPLEKLDEPASLHRLRDGVQARLPRVDLSDVILEVKTWTCFADAFTHISEGNARVHDLTTSICAVLLAEACNIGLEPLIRPDVPALTRGRLEWVQQNYIRAETIARANAVLVDAQARIPLAQAWGGGDVASADGLRFRVPVRTINAGASPPYFHFGVGVTYYNLSSDQFSGLRHIVVPGTLKDGPYLLAVLLEQDTQVQPTIVMTDSGSYAVMWTHAGQTRSLRGTRHGKEASRCASNACAPRTAVRSLWCCSMTTTGRSRPCRGSSATSPRATTRRTPCRPMPTICSTSCASSRGAVAPSRISRRRSRWTSSPTCARCPAGDMRNASASPCVRPRTASPPSACRPPRSTASSPPFRPFTNISSSRGNWTATTPCRPSTTRRPPVSPTATDPPWAARAGNVPSVASSGSRRSSVSRAR